VTRPSSRCAGSAARDRGAGEAQSHSTLALPAFSVCGSTVGLSQPSGRALVVLPTGRLTGCRPPGNVPSQQAECPRRAAKRIKRWLDSSDIQIEQYLDRALAFADRAIVLDRGTIAWSGLVADANAISVQYVGQVAVHEITTGENTHPGVPFDSRETGS
jgi:hypothetical protein